MTDDGEVLHGGVANAGAVVRAGRHVLPGVPAGPLLPDGLATLASAAEEERIGIVPRIVDRWVDGTESAQPSPSG